MKAEIHMKNNQNPVQKIAVIGCGRWGSFIAWYLDKTGHSITLYGRESSANMQKFLDCRKNDILTLPESVALSTDLCCVSDTDIIAISICSQNLRSLAGELAKIGIKNKIIVLCMKGIEISTGKRLSQVITDIVDPSNEIAVWLGPGHVQEFCSDIPNCMVIDSNNAKVKDFLINSFSSRLIRFYYGEDMIGNEIGAAAKNVIGIAAGMLDGLSLSSLKGALMSRGTREIARLIKVLGGNELSAYGLCHLGDYEATIFSKHSHNRMFGELFVKGETYGQLAEGFYTAAALKKIAEDFKVEIPICNAVYNILYSGVSPHQALDDLFARSLKKELN